MLFLGSSQNGNIYIIFFLDYTMKYGHNNWDERYVCELANSLNGVSARMATREEDCGYHKADVVASYGKGTYYFQVSHTPKSKRETEKLLKRGTHPISTHKFKDMPLGKEDLVSKIRGIIKI